MDRREIDKEIKEFGAFLKTIKRNLERLGFIFSYPDEVLPGPNPSDMQRITKMEKAIGSVPYAIKAYYMTVGPANFIGKHPEWVDSFYSDPFYMASFDYFDWELEKFVNDPEEKQWYMDAYGGFVLQIAPDYFLKDDTSGGPPYCIAIPNDSDDPAVKNYFKATTFMEYLKDVKKCSGFPGLEEEMHNWPLHEISAL